MTTPSNPPQYQNQPVILVHLSVSPNDGIGPDMYWCAPYFVVNESDPPAYPNIPRVPCPSCAMAHTR